jgi:hypothetical protein
MPCRHYLRALDPPTSTVTPPPFTCTSAAPELHQPLQHRLPPTAAPPDLLMTVVDSLPAPWTLPPSERRGGRGAAETTQPPRLPPAPYHQHAASSIPTTRVAAGIMDAKILAAAEPSERCRGVIASVLQCLPRRLRHPHGRPPLPPRGGWGSSRDHLVSQATPRSTVTASANLAPSSGLSGRDLTAYDARRGKIPRPPRPPVVSTTRARNHHRRIQPPPARSGLLMPPRGASCRADHHRRICPPALRGGGS